MTIFENFPGKNEKRNGVSDKLRSLCNRFLNNISRSTSNIFGYGYVYFNYVYVFYLGVESRKVGIDTKCVDVTRRGKIVNSWTCRDCHRIRVYFNINQYAPDLDKLDKTYSIYVKLSVRVQFDKWAHPALQPIYIGDNEYRIPFSKEKDFTDGYIDFSAEFRPLGTIRPEVVSIRTGPIRNEPCRNPAELVPRRWTLTNPDDPVSDCYLTCKPNFEGGTGEGLCENHCGVGAYCCNGATKEPPYNICTSVQMEPLLEHSPRIMHHVCVTLMEGSTPLTPTTEDLVCVPDCETNQTSVNGECICATGYHEVQQGKIFIGNVIIIRIFRN